MSARGLALQGVLVAVSLWAGSAPAPLRAADSDGVWSTSGQGTTERSEIAAVELNGKIYVAGGEALGRQDSPLFQEFDPATGRWRDLAPLPKGASHVGMAALNGKIYVAGGFTANVHKNPRDQFIEYDPATNAWRELPPLPAPLGSVSLVALGNGIHVIGGRGPDGNTVATHSVFSPASGQWSMAAPLPVARDHLGMILLDGKIHVFGGRTNATVDNVGLHDVYDPATNSWTSSAPLPVPRSSGAAVVYRGQILYWGGECKDAKARIAYDEFHGYDPKSNSWLVLAEAPTPMHAQAAAVVRDTVYFFGGSTSCGGDKPSKTVYSFRLP